MGFPVLQLTVLWISVRSQSEVEPWQGTPVTGVLNSSDRHAGFAVTTGHGFLKGFHFVVSETPE